MKWKHAVKRIFVILVICIEIMSINISKKTDFDKDDARAVLADTYRPLEEFASGLVYSKYEGLLEVPRGIKSEYDFVALFDGRMAEHNARDFYEDLFVEKNDGLYVDAEEYIPSIYTDGTIIKKAYIREKQSIIDRIMKRDHRKTVELIIKLELGMDRSTSKRTEYFVMTDDGRWMLDRANGLSLCGFTDAKDNPWSENWKTKP